MDLTQARNQYEIAKQHLEALGAIGERQTIEVGHGSIGIRERQVQGAEAQLSYSEIRSPINGVITDRPLYPGEMAAAGTPLLTVMDISQVIAQSAHSAERSGPAESGRCGTMTRSEDSISQSPGK